MGLDMFAFETREKIDDFGFKAPADAVLIQQWRKHPNLHGWMEQLYRSRGGERRFNCITLRLTAEDIDDLEKAVMEDNLPYTEGFFFGESRPEHKDDDIEFIRDAREAFQEGSQVYYDSWW